MSKLFKVMTLLAGYFCLIACQHQASYAEYENPEGPYNRTAICQRLNELLTGFKGPHDYKSKDISRRELAQLYHDYKVYGCEK